MSDYLPNPFVKLERCVTPSYFLPSKDSTTPIITHVRSISQQDFDQLSSGSGSTDMCRGRGNVASTVPSSATGGCPGQQVASGPAVVGPVVAWQPVPAADEYYAGAFTAVLLGEEVMGDGGSSAPEATSNVNFLKHTPPPVCVSTCEIWQD